MLKLRLTRTGRKKQPAYRIVVMEHSTRRDGRPVEQVGYYSPFTKQITVDADKIRKWLGYGAKPTETVNTLLKIAKIIEE